MISKMPFQDILLENQVTKAIILLIKDKKLVRKLFFEYNSKNDKI